ncbi:hypothetical protein ACFL20_13760 [Spirochaetota bacterium]
MDGPDGTLSNDQNISGLWPKIQACDGKLFVAFIENMYLYVKEYNGNDDSPQWLTLSNPGYGQVQYASLGCYDNKLYAGIVDLTSLYVLYWDKYSNSWFDTGIMKPGYYIEFATVGSYLYAVHEYSGVIYASRHSGSMNWDDAEGSLNDPSGQGINDKINTVRNPKVA